VQIDEVMALDYATTGKCRFSLMPENFLPAFKSSLPMGKGSPYTEAFNEGYNRKVI